MFKYFSLKYIRDLCANIIVYINAANSLNRELYELHKVWKRRTFYTCHMLCDYVSMLSSETILVIGSTIDDFDRFVEILSKVAPQYPYKLRHIDKANKRIIFDDGYFDKTGMGVQIKYMSPRTLSMMSPVDAGISFDHNPILDLRHMPPEIYSDDIGIYNLDKLGKYIK